MPKMPFSVNCIFLIMVTNVCTCLVYLLKMLHSCEDRQVLTMKPWFTNHTFLQA